MLKRSQKFCPNCKEINPIRSFNCKKCKYEFPQKNKKINKSIENSTLEKFLTKKTNIIRDEEEENEKINKENNLKVIINNENIINLYEECEEFKIEYKNLKDDKFLIKKEDELVINLENLKSCLKYKFDIISYFKLFYCIIIYQNIEDKEIYLLIIENNGIEIKNYYQFKYYKQILNKEYYLNYIVKFFIKDNNYFLNFNQKEILNNFIICLDNKILCLNLLKLNNKEEIKIYKIFEINKKFPILNIDCYNENNNILLILFSDSNNKIFFYIYNILEKLLLLKSLTENFFISKITDIKILIIKNKISKNIYYFSTCSRDGILLVFDSNNNIILKHKTYQTWITKIEFIPMYNIIIFLTNFDDKMVGIKLSNNKEPIIKRIQQTNNPYLIENNNLDNTLYYLDSKNNIFSIKTYLIDDMFKTSKSKKKNEYIPHLEFTIKNEVENFQKFFKIISLFDKKGEKKLIITKFNNCLNFKII